MNTNTLNMSMLRRSELSYLVRYGVLTIAFVICLLTGVKAQTQSDFIKIESSSAGDYLTLKRNASAWVGLRIENSANIWRLETSSDGTFTIKDQSSGTFVLTAKKNGEGVVIYDKLQTYGDIVTSGKLTVVGDISTSGNLTIAGSLSTTAIGFDSDNVAIGNYALDANLNSTSGGTGNVAIGTAALIQKSGVENTIAIGSSAFYRSGGSENIGLGIHTGFYNATGTNNTMVGHYSGRNSTGSGNIFIGYKSGYNETGSNKLYVDNSDSSTPLIYGDFSTDELTFNGDVEVDGSLNTEQIKISSGNSSGEYSIFYWLNGDFTLDIGNTLNSDFTDASILFKQDGVTAMEIDSDGQVVFNDGDFQLGSTLIREVDGNVRFTNDDDEPVLTFDGPGTHDYGRLDWIDDNEQTIATVAVSQDFSETGKEMTFEMFDSNRNTSALMTLSDEGNLFVSGDLSANKLEGNNLSLSGVLLSPTELSSMKTLSSGVNSGDFTIEDDVPVLSLKGFQSYTGFNTDLGNGIGTRFAGIMVEESIDYGSGITSDVTIADIEFSVRGRDDDSEGGGNTDIDGAIIFKTGEQLDGSSNPALKERMVISADGKVGIGAFGTDVPDEALEVQGNIKSNGTIDATSFTSGGQALVSSPWTAIEATTSIPDGIIYSGNVNVDGDLDIFTTDNMEKMTLGHDGVSAYIDWSHLTTAGAPSPSGDGSLLLKHNGVTYMELDRNGKLTIGESTTSPGAQVYGNITASGTIDATSFTSGGQALVSSPWTATAAGIEYTGDVNVTGDITSIGAINAKNLSITEGVDFITEDKSMDATYTLTIGGQSLGTDGTDESAIGEITFINDLTGASNVTGTQDAARIVAKFDASDQSGSLHFQTIDGTNGLTDGMVLDKAGNLTVSDTLISSFIHIKGDGANTATIDARIDGTVVFGGENGSLTPWVNSKGTTIPAITNSTINSSYYADYAVWMTSGLVADDIALSEATDWSDFVFENDYALSPLSEVEAFINVNGHLPEVPSAAEVSEKGYRLHQMNKTLLQKIEELTLYTIEQDKQIRELQEMLEQLMHK